MRIAGVLALFASAFALPIGARAQSPYVASEPPPPESTRTSRVNPVLEQYRTAHAAWFTPDERARLDAIDLRGTWTGEPHTLRWLAADRALRQFAPIALDAVVRAREASHLRSAPGVIDTRTASLVMRDRVVAAAFRRRARIDTETAERFATRTATWGLDPPPDPNWRADERSLAADRAIIAAADAALHDDVGEVAAAAGEAAFAVGESERPRVVDAAIALLQDMATAAQAVPIREDGTAPSHVAAVDPLAPAPPNPPARARTRVARPRAHAPPPRVAPDPSPPVQPPSVGLDDFDALPP
jgi:hypothetical protein